MTIKEDMKNMKNDKMMGSVSHYTLWLGIRLIKTENHTQEGYDNLLARAQTYMEKGLNCSIFSSREEDAVWDSKWAKEWAHEFDSSDLTIDEEELIALCDEDYYA
jgi:hypothetical protein